MLGSQGTLESPWNELVDWITLLEKVGDSWGFLADEETRNRRGEKQLRDHPTGFGGSGESHVLVRGSDQSYAWDTQVQKFRKYTLRNRYLKKSREEGRRNCWTVTGKGKRIWPSWYSTRAETPLKKIACWVSRWLGGTRTTMIDTLSWSEQVPRNCNYIPKHSQQNNEYC